jgi:cathepsin A (carboxypeptidase C)
LTWINGGPGCSSSLGLFMELGPCSIVDPTHLNGTKRNPNSWNDKANVMFIEQPIGVSFSYGKHGQTTSSTEEAAIDIQAFVSIFFQTFKEFNGRDYYMSGESYGGRYLPLFASAILDGNKALVKQGLEPVNLKGVLIGNGLTDLCE